MVIKDILKPYEDRLKDAIYLLSRILDVDKSYIHLNLNGEVSEEDGTKFTRGMEAYKKGYPLQYLVGDVDFMGLRIGVEEGVLIPRPDTEVLVEYIIKNYKDKGPSILEIGSGSGAIALALGHYIKNSRITSVDISEKALDLSNKNKEALGLKNVEFLKSNMFSSLGGERYDIILSNPPYIRSGDIEGLDSMVKDHEPRLALDGGSDGLDFYRDITRDGKNYLKKDGLLIYEIGYDQGEDVSLILKEHSYRDIKILKDLEDRDRVVLGFL